MRFSNLRKVSFGGRVKLECLQGRRNLKLRDMPKQLSECIYFDIEKKKGLDIYLTVFGRMSYNQEIKFWAGPSRSK